MAFCDRQLYYYYYYYFFFGFCTPLNRGAGAVFSSFFLLFVAKMTIQRDDDVLPSGFFLTNAASAESGGQPEVVKWFC